MRGIEFFHGLKARHVIARPEGPGDGGGTDIRPVGATRSMFRPYRAENHFGHVSQGFTLGYHMTGFQPYAIAALKGRHVIARPEGPGDGGGMDIRPVGATRSMFRPYRAENHFGHVSQGFTLGYNITGFQPYAIAALKGRHVIARPEGPGKGTAPSFSTPCNGGTLDAESAEVLETIKGLLA